MRIMVIGDSASGKSTFAIKLSRILEIPLIHLDELMDKVGRDNREEIGKIIRQEAEKGAWIIDGNAFTKDLEYRIRRSDKVFIFESSRVGTLLRHINRFFKIKFGSDERVGSKNTKLNLSYFIPYIFVKFPNRRNNAKKLAQSLGKEVVTFRSKKDADSYLLNIE